MAPKLDSIFDGQRLDARVDRAIIVLAVDSPFVPLGFIVNGRVLSAPWTSSDFRKFDRAALWAVVPTFDPTGFPSHRKAYDVASDTG